MKKGIQWSFDVGIDVEVKHYEIRTGWMDDEHISVEDFRLALHSTGVLMVEVVH